jgi:hypothetical protein
MQHEVLSEEGVTLLATKFAKIHIYVESVTCHVTQFVELVIF